MGRSRYTFHESDYPYFVTASTVHWIPLFSRPEIASICIDSLQFLQKQEGLKIYAWVLLENHLHAVLRSPELPSILRRFKSFTGRKIVDYFQEHHANDLLADLAWNKTAHKHSQDFQVWQEGVHPEQICSREMMVQKIEYIHNNPVKRGFVDLPEHWRYSSARNYLGSEGLIEIVKSW